MQSNNYFSKIKELNKKVCDAIELKNENGYPIFFANILSHSELDRLAKAPRGSYQKNPTEIYLQAQRNLGVEFIDQYIPDNPLTITEHGYENAEKTATTGTEAIIVDGIKICEPEDVVEHLEKFHIPSIKERIKNFDKEQTVFQIGEKEVSIQKEMGESMLKTGYEYIQFPLLDYYTYGYENYFCAYALYPEIIEEVFALESKYFRMKNMAAKEAIEIYNLPKLFRLDHDMTDSRGTLVDIKSLEKIWFPHFYNAIEPLANSDLRMIWHCDGNITPMIEPLLECGIKGFQGFQYEDGVDFAKICSMQTRDKQPLFIIGGISVTRTLPMGTADDVKKEFKFLVENKGKSTLALAPSSSVAPGTPSENIDALLEGFHYYKENNI